MKTAKTKVRATATSSGKEEEILLPAPCFSGLDRHFAALMQRMAGGPHPLVSLAAALVSRQRREGHVCLELASVAGRILGDAELGIVRCPELERWLEALRACEVVGQPGAFKPLILDAGNRLYLHRYWNFEQRLAKAILSRTNAEANAPASVLQAILDRHFPPGEPGAEDQRHAAETAVTRRFAVISGGPGTGKTHTLVRLLRVLQDLSPDAPPRLALAAPTGKAAARIQEELQRPAAGVPEASPLRSLAQVEAVTLHRLLGARSDRAEFRHHAGNPIPADVIVVDEASMVDLALMSRLFDAAAPATRVVLLGDKDQLASVEAGAVLGDICAVPAEAQEHPLARCIVELTHHHRFGDASAIARFSRATRTGDADAALAVLVEGGSTFTSRPLPARSERMAALRAPLLDAWGGGVKSDPEEMLALLARFRILCAVREGPFGVNQINELAATLLEEAGILDRGRGAHYPGQPILITRNDYAQRLFNGDTGIVLPHASDGSLRAWFASPDGGVRSVLPARLPEHEIVFAMTVHKSQGSEFQRVLMLLPDRSSPVLTRELIYTAATRARERVELWFAEPVFREALARRAERHSGLRDALWGVLS